MMTPIDIEGAQVELGRAQGFVPLKIRFEMTYDTGTKQQYPSMVCAMMPSQEDRMKILAGEPIELRIIGIDWPPVDVTVGLSEYDKQAADVAWAYAEATRKQRAEERVKEATRKRVESIKDSLKFLKKD